MVQAAAGLGGSATVSRASALLASGAVVVAVVAKQALYLALGRGLNLFEDGTALAGGARMLRGQVPYTDFFAFYGPLTYLVPAVVHRLVGSVSSGIFVTQALIAVVTAVASYLVTLALTRRVVVSMAAPAVIVLLGAYTARPLPALIGLVLLSRYERDGRRRWLVASGVSAAAGLLWIQDAGAWLCVAVFVVWIAHLLRPSRRKAFDAKAFGVFSAGVGLGLAPWVTYVLDKGAFAAWITWTFVFPLTGYTQRSATGYLRTLIDSLGEVSIPRAVYVFLLWVFPLIAAFLLAAFALVALGVQWWRSRVAAHAPVTRLVLAVYAVLQLRVLAASVDEAKLIDAIAPTIVATVVVVVSWISTSQRLRAQRAAAAVVAAWLVVWPLWYQARSLAEAVDAPRPSVVAGMGGLPISQASPPLTTPAELGELLADVQSRTRAGDAILVLPTSPMLYVASERINPTRFDYLDPVYTTADVDQEIRDEAISGRIRLVLLADATFPGTELSTSDLAPLTYASIMSHFVVVSEIGRFAVLEPR